METVLLGVFSLLLIMLAWFGLVPLMPLIGETIRARVKLTTFDLRQIPPVQASQLQNVLRVLEADGFAAEAFLRPVPSEKAGAKMKRPSHVFSSEPVPVTLFVVLAHRVGGHEAIVTLTAPKTDVSKPAPAGRISVLLRTRFPGGRRAETTNTGDLSPVPPEPGVVRTFLPSLQDPHRLFLFHQFTLENVQGMAQRELKEIYPPGEATAYLTDFLEGTLQYWADSDYLEFTETKTGEDAYKYTVKGAYWMTWNQMFPVGQVRAYLRAKREQEHLALFYRSGRGSGTKSTVPS